MTLDYNDNRVKTKTSNSSYIHYDDYNHSYSCINNTDCNNIKIHNSNNSNNSCKVKENKYNI